jgi:hypothetical protein
MKINNLLSLGLTALIIASTGCASIVSRSNWPVAFKSNPPGAEVVVADDSGKELHRGITPVIFKLRSGQAFFESDDYQVDMKLPGYQEDKGVLKANLNGWYFGNIFFGGLLGLIIVDPMTGAMWRLPAEYNVSLAPDSVMRTGSTSAPQK